LTLTHKVFTSRPRLWQNPAATTTDEPAAGLCQSRGPRGISASNCHWRGQRWVMLIAFQREISRFDLFKPFRLVLAGLGKFRDPFGNHQSWCCKRLPFELLTEHLEMVFINVSVSNEVSKPAWRVAS